MGDEVFDCPFSDPVEDVGALVVDVADAGDVVAVEDLKARAKNVDDPLEIVIVRDMWLTGFDAPSMHTMYVDKTMRTG